MTSGVKMKIGFIGTGIMGLPMATHLLNDGHSLKVFNRTRSKAQSLALLGAELVDSAREAAEEVDLLISIVSKTSDVREVLLGEQGAAKGANKGTLFIDMSTIDVNETVVMAEELNDLEIDFVDAPVSGGDVGAQNATLTIFCGGDKDNIERAIPILEVLGKTISHMGGCGKGQATKACNQIIAAGAMLGVCEALNHGQAQGLDLHQLIKATSGGSAQSWQLDNLGPKMASGDFSPGFMVDLLHKDLRMVLDALPAHSPSMNITQQMVARLEKLQLDNAGGEGTQAVFKTYSPQNL